MAGALLGGGCRCLESPLGGGEGGWTVGFSLFFGVDAAHLMGGFLLFRKQDTWVSMTKSRLGPTSVLRGQLICVLPPLLRGLKGEPGCTPGFSSPKRTPLLQVWGAELLPEPPGCPGVCSASPKRPSVFSPVLFQQPSPHCSPKGQILLHQDLAKTFKCGVLKKKQIAIVFSPAPKAS